MKPFPRTAPWMNPETHLRARPVFIWLTDLKVCSWTGLQKATLTQNSAVPARASPPPVKDPILTGLAPIDGLSNNYRSMGVKPPEGFEPPAC